MQSRKFWAGVGIVGLVLGLGISSPLGADEAAPLLTPAMMGQVDAPGGEPSFLDTIDFSGSVDIAYTFNFNSTDNDFFNPAGTTGAENPARVFDRFHNEFTVHNAIINIERPVDAEQIFGFAVTPALGVDGQITGGGGFDLGTGQTDANGNVDFDILQAYVQMFVPEEFLPIGKTTVKLGKFYTPIGAETIPSHENTMFSRTALFGYAIPFTHTGVMIDNSLVERDDQGEMLGAYFGLTNGWDSARDTNDGHAYMLGGRLSPIEYLNLNINWIFGNIDRGATGDNDQFSHLVDIVGTVKVPEVGLSFSGNFDWYGDENGGNYADYYGFAGIARLDFADLIFDLPKENLYLAMRGEFVDDPDGFLGSVGTQLYDLTWTLGVKPADFVLIRFEVRYDKADIAIFENGSRSHQTTIAVNTVFTF